MIFTADFETTQDPDDCRVWAYGLCEIGGEFSFKYGNTIDQFMALCQKTSSTIYFHKLSFDGEFVLIWLFEHGYEFNKDNKNLQPYQFSTLISESGTFYSIEVLHPNRKRTKFYDSHNIIPFGVKQIAKDFGLPLQKLEIDYAKPRPIGYVPDLFEIEYLRHDVEIMARALKTYIDDGLNRMTEASNAMADYKHTVTLKKFQKWFPPPEYDAEIRQAFKGGFTYVHKPIRGKTLPEGISLDVNSLYPWIMRDLPLPYGEPKSFKGKYKKDEVYPLYIQMFTCNFKLKKDHIPSVSGKCSSLFVETKYLENSGGDDITFCMTSVDLDLFYRQYEVANEVWHGGWMFKAATGLFSAYVDKWTAKKIAATIEGNKAKRAKAKRMQNALYGKFATNPNVSNRTPIYSHGRIHYKVEAPKPMKPVYIPVAAFITAYGRATTITAAQSLYHRFAYADTDSIHLIGTEPPDGLEIHPTKLGAWKIENHFYRAKFLKPKTYIEEIYVDGEFIKEHPEKTYCERPGGIATLSITCAGMPESCYKYVNWSNFQEGMSFDGKLMPAHVKGGIVLQNTKFTILYT